MRSLPRSIPSLALVLAVGAAGAARAAECPDPRPVTGAFRAVQVSPGTVVTFPPAGTTIANANTAEIQRGLTLSGAITGLDRAATDTEMGLTLQLDVIRYLKTGQGYGTGEVTVTSRPPVPFMTAGPAFQGRINAVVRNGNELTGYFAAVGAGEHAGASLRGRFTARLNVSSAAPSPGPTPNPFGGGPTNPLAPGAGNGGVTNPFSGGGGPANPLAPGSGGAVNPLLNPGGSPSQPSLPGATSLRTVEVIGSFGGPAGPAVVVERDPVALVAIAGSPDLARAMSGLFPLVQPSVARLSLQCAGGQITACPEAGAPAGEGVETRQGASGKGSISLRSGRASASYRAEFTLESVRTTGPPGDSDYGYAQGQIRLFARGTQPVYEGTIDGTLTPLFTRGRPVRGRFLWTGFLALNRQNTSPPTNESLRSAFTAVGTYVKGRLAPIRLEMKLGDADDPFMRVMASR